MHQSDMIKTLLVICYDAGEFNGLRTFLQNTSCRVHVLFLGQGAYKVGYQWVCEHLGEQAALLPVTGTAALAEQAHKAQPWHSSILESYRQLFINQPIVIVGTPALVQGQLAKMAQQNGCRVIAYHDVVDCDIDITRIYNICDYIDEIWVANAENKKLLQQQITLAIHIVGHCELSLQQLAIWQYLGQHTRKKLNLIFGEATPLHTWIGAYGAADQIAFKQFLTKTTTLTTGKLFIMIHPGAPTKNGLYAEEQTLNNANISYQTIGHDEDASHMDQQCRVFIIFPNHPQLSSTALVAAAPTSCHNSTLAIRAVILGNYPVKFYQRNHVIAKNDTNLLTRHRFLQQGLPTEPHHAMQLAFNNIAA